MEGQLPLSRALHGFGIYRVCIVQASQKSLERRWSRSGKILYRPAHRPHLGLVSADALSASHPLHGDIRRERCPLGWRATDVMKERVNVVLEGSDDGTRQRQSGDMAEQCFQYGVRNNVQGNT